MISKGIPVINAFSEKRVFHLLNVIAYIFFLHLVRVVRIIRIESRKVVCQINPTIRIKLIRVVFRDLRPEMDQIAAGNVLRSSVISRKLPDL